MKQVLLIDDDPGDVKLLLHFMTGYQLSVLMNAKIAKEYFLTDSKPLTDIVILDLNIPLGDGHEVLQVIRKVSRWDPVHIVIWSSSSDPDEIQRCLRFANTSYAIKPHSLDGLRDFVALIKQRLC